MRGDAMGEMRAELLLPFGLVGGDGARERTAVVMPLTGHGELHGADDPNPFRATAQLLAASIVRLGPFRGAEVGPELLGRLLSVDRDYLLLHLNRVTFGDVRYQTVECPQVECRRRLDVRFALSSAEPPTVTAAAGSIELPDGRAVCFRLPVAADQEALHGLAPSVLEAALLERCVRSDPDDDRQVGWSELMEMPAAIRATVVRRIVAESPEIDLAMPLACLACGRRFRFVFDPVLSLLAELKASRGELIRQVHRLALHYHWSHSEILGLSRSLRHDYLGLLDEAGR